jgi:hypothetical protein
MGKDLKVPALHATYSWPPPLSQRSSVWVGICRGKEQNPKHTTPYATHLPDLLLSFDSLLPGWPTSAYIAGGVSGKNALLGLASSRNCIAVDHSSD